ncbi:quercetin 2,3-dioxygenase [Aureococcus anophagefferens]|uniref:Quercetin 2,3-dioxygenase n=1 Tax=Aureococcus anophagefferens TaxID=44056 RepID=A0ABR1G255_AURAN
MVRGALALALLAAGTAAPCFFEVLIDGACIVSRFDAVDGADVDAAAKGLAALLPLDALAGGGCGGDAACAQRAVRAGFEGARDACLARGVGSPCLDVVDALRRARARPAAPFARARGAYLGVSEASFGHVAEFWLRRDALFLDALARRLGGAKLAVLDVGSGTRRASAPVVASDPRRARALFVDVDDPDQRNRGGGAAAVATYARSFDGFAERRPVVWFDGRTVPAPDDSYAVCFTYVLHHAAGATIKLLREARRVSKRYVVFSPRSQRSDSDGGQHNNSPYVPWSEEESSDEEPPATDLPSRTVPWTPSASETASRPQSRMDTASL